MKFYEIVLPCCLNLLYGERDTIWIGDSFWRNRNALLDYYFFPCRLKPQTKLENKNIVVFSDPSEAFEDDSMDITGFKAFQKRCNASDFKENETETLRKQFDASMAIGNDGKSKNSTAFLNSTSEEEVINAEKLNKWICQTCTYENWPKSSKCTMCKHVRDQQPSSSSSSFCGTICKTSVDNICKSKSQNILKSKSFEQKDSREKEIILQNVAKKKQCSFMNSQDDYESIGRHTRNWKMDKLWMNACVGVVENQYTAVEEFLEYGGSPTRALTARECILLNRNSAFDIGYTLIHLAIRLVNY